jgi:hypothetical protein
VEGHQPPTTQLPLMILVTLVTQQCIYLQTIDLVEIKMQIGVINVTSVTGCLLQSDTLPQPLLAGPGLSDAPLGERPAEGTEGKGYFLTASSPLPVSLIDSSGGNNCRWAKDT